MKGITPSLDQRGLWVRVMVCKDCGAVVGVVKGSEHLTSDGDTSWSMAGALPCVCVFCGQPFLTKYASDESGNRQTVVFRHIDLCSGLCTVRWTGTWYLPWTWLQFETDWELKRISAIEDKGFRPPSALDRIAGWMKDSTKGGEA